MDWDCHGWASAVCGGREARTGGGVSAWVSELGGMAEMEASGSYLQPG